MSQFYTFLLIFKCGIKGNQDLDTIRQLLLTIPEDNFSLLRHITKFLYKLSKFSEVNMMDCDNLGIVFGPTLMKSKEEVETKTANQIQSTSDTISLLIKFFKKLFRKAGGSRINNFADRMHVERSVSSGSVTSRKRDRSTSIMSNSPLVLATPRRNEALKNTREGNRSTSKLKRFVVINETA